MDDEVFVDKDQIYILWNKKRNAQTTGVSSAFA